MKQRDWHELSTPEQIDELMLRSGNFHDGCVREIHVATSHYVAENLSMAVDWRTTVHLLVQRQHRNASAIELRFTEVVGLKVSPPLPNHEAIILVIIPLTKLAGVERMTGIEDASPALLEFLGPYLAVLWKDWPMDMKVSLLNAGPERFLFSLRGLCPHCSTPTTFLTVGSPHVDFVTNHNLIKVAASVWAAMQCQGCMQFILGGIRVWDLETVSPPKAGYIAHYPLHKPNDEVADEIPTNIASDFKEALRCRWVDAYNATVEMCRRALAASCIGLQAEGKNLADQIDWLAAKSIITAPLQQMAHKIRLGGNRGAHPPEDPDDIMIGPVYADAVIEFTRDYFHHVYVTPKRLEKYDFSKKAVSGSAS